MKRFEQLLESVRQASEILRAEREPPRGSTAEEVTPIATHPLTSGRRTLEELIAATPSFEGVPEWNDMADVGREREAFGKLVRKPE